jgi:hypothetical protein
VPTKKGGNMREAKWKTVLKALESREYITNMDIVRMVKTTSPHDKIRVIRNRGINVADRTPAGKRHKEYFLVK